MLLLFKVDHKRNSAKNWKDCLALFNCNSDYNFHFITVHETWIHHTHGITSKQYASIGESVSKKTKLGLSSNKVVASIFRMYAVHFSSITFKWKNHQWRILCQRIRSVKWRFEEIWPHFAKKNVLLRQDNARLHRCDRLKFENWPTKYSMIRRVPQIYA